MDHPRIVQTPDVCFGKPRIAGRRLPVAVLLEAVAGQGDLGKVAAAHGCSVEDVKAALLYAADLIWGARNLDDLFDESRDAIAAE